MESCPASSSILSQRNAKIMEVGYGAGEFLRLTKRYGDPTWSLLGVDISDTHSATLQKSGIVTVNSRFEDVHGYDGSLDAIVMNQVIEHLADPVAIIRKAYSMLKAGGVLIIETPSLEGWDAALFLRNGLWEGWHAPRHWQLFDEKKLSTLAKEAGFEVRQAAYILSPYLWIHSIKNYLEFHHRAEWLCRFLTLDNFLALSAVSLIDMIQLIVRRKTSNMRIVSQKPKTTVN
jgi:2-polyprenyl-3-methyl-5-hydroxy-6-metoxy-1,4-benzoquinol methylase